MTVIDLDPIAREDLESRQFVRRRARRGLSVRLSELREGDEFFFVPVDTEYEEGLGGEGYCSPERVVVVDGPSEHRGTWRVDVRRARPLYDEDGEAVDLGPFSVTDPFDHAGRFRALFFRA